MAAPQTPRRSPPAQTVHRAMTVLRCFEAARGELGISEIASSAGLTVSTAHRLTRALCDAGLVTQDARTERYRLGPLLVVLGRRAEEQLGYSQARPTLEELADSTGESVNLGVRSGNEVLVVLDIVSKHPLRFEQAPGTRVPIHTSAMGKCLLAFARDHRAEVRGLPPLQPVTDRTITGHDDLVAELEVARRRGWALNDEERNVGVRAVAAPAVDRDGLAVAAVAVQGPVLRMTDDRLDELGAQIAQAAKVLGPLLPASR